MMMELKNNHFLKILLSILLFCTQVGGHRPHFRRLRIHSDDDPSKDIVITEIDNPVMWSVNHIPENFIPNDYSSIESPPTLYGRAARVNVSVIIMNVRGIDEKERLITLELNLRMYWKDSRLGPIKNVTRDNPFLVLSPKLLNDIWHPDIFFDHSIEVTQPTIITVPASLRIYKDTNIIRYSARITVVTACDMNFKHYPADIQKCAIHLMSYAYKTKVMDLAWDTKRGAFFSDYLPKHPDFDIELDNVTRTTVNTSSASYYNLQFNIVLRRNISYHLIQTYLPSSIFLLVSWVTLLLGSSKYFSERISCCMMSLLSLTVMFGSLSKTSPRVSYFTGLHMWMCMCVFLVFLAFAEFVVVLKLRRLALSLGQEEVGDDENFFGMNNQQNSVIVPPSTGGATTSVSLVSRRPVPVRVKGEKYAKAAKHLERAAVFVLPGIFLVFNCAYWPWLFIR